MQDYTPLEKLKYVTDDKYLTIYEKSIDGKLYERYHIEKKHCMTLDNQLDWVLHMSEKNWIHSYEFKKEFLKALEQWNLVNTKDKKGKVSNGAV